ncbi:MAG: hypothetical protein CMG69_04850 [Candidatus Marinimicrobia bacterium]|nr:hypothetical protein [Candidatus Neomarinimicrobiota bacterium]
MKKNDTHFIDRYVITGILLSLFLYNPIKSESNGQLVDFDYQNTSLKTALDSLIDSHQVAIIYQDRHLEGKRISAKCAECTMEAALNTLFLGHGLKWKHKGKQYIVIAKAKSGIKREFILKGVVRDKLSGEPILYANVHIQNTHFGDITNQEGYFYIPTSIDSGSVNISYIGYEPITVPIFFSEATDSLYVIELFPKVIRSEGVTVTGDNMEFFSQPMKTGQISFSPKHIASLPKLGETDIFRTLKLLPGIQIGNIGSAGLYIRGGTPDQNLILLDGMSVYQTDHFYGFFSAINSEAVKDIQIYKGGFPAKYGGRISSVIEMTGRQGNTKKRRLSFYSNFLTAGLTYEEPLFGRGSLFMTYRSSYSDYYRTFLFDNIYNFLTDGEGQNSLVISSESSDYNPQLSFYDFNGKITFMPNDHNILSISFFTGNDDIERLYNFPQDTAITYLDGIQDASRWKNQSGSVKWSRIWGNNFYSHILLSKSNYSSNSFYQSRYLGDLEYTVDISDDNTLDDFTLRFDNEWSLSLFHDIEFGISRKVLNTKYELKFQDNESEIEKYRANVSSIYFQDRWQILSNAEIIWGWRFSKYDLNNKLFVEPRTSFKYHLSKYLTLKGSLDNYTQFIHRFSNNYMIGGKKYVWLLSNDNLKPSDSRQINLGLRYDDRNLNSEVTIFYRDFQKISSFSFIQFPTDSYKSNYNRLNGDNVHLGTGKSKGLEILIQKKRGSIRGWVSYSFGISEQRFPDSGFNRGVVFPANHDRTHEMKSVITSTYNNWDFSLFWIFSSGSVFTPQGMQYFSEDVYPYAILPDSSASLNSQRLPIIHRIDVSIIRHIRIMSVDWEFGLSVFNLFDQKNISHKKYITLDNTKIVSTDVEMLGFTPTFFVRLTI